MYRVPTAARALAMSLVDNAAPHLPVIDQATVTDLAADSLPDRPLALTALSGYGITGQPAAEIVETLAGAAVVG